MRASKLRFPDSTLAAMRSFVVSVSSSSRSSGPELPMHVVQPNPTTLKPSRSRNGCSPVFVRYSLTTREPGASEVFTHGLTLSPCSTAFFASRPAASITVGFEVLVHDVMAAITTSPCVSSTVDGRARLRARLAEPVRRRPVVHHLGFGECVGVVRAPVGKRVFRLLAATRARRLPVCQAAQSRARAASGFP